MEAPMKASLYGLLLAGLLVAPLSTEARGGGGGGGGWHGGMTAGGAAGQALATFPFQSTIGVARQAAIISRLRAQQAISNQITASGGLIGGFGGFDGGFAGFDGGFAGFGGGLGLGIPGSGFAASGSQLRAPIVAHPHVITVTSSPTQPGEIQIIRGTSVENVKIPATH
jgi:hypothetical protein